MDETKPKLMINNVQVAIIGTAKVNVPSDQKFKTGLFLDVGDISFDLIFDPATTPAVASKLTHQTPADLKPTETVVIQFGKQKFPMKVVSSKQRTDKDGYITLEIELEKFDG